MPAALSERIRLILFTLKPKLANWEKRTGNENDNLKGMEPEVEVRYCSEHWILPLGRSATGIGPFSRPTALKVSGGTALFAVFVRSTVGLYGPINTFV